MERQNKIQKYCNAVIFVLIGNFILAYAVQALIIPNNILSGGVAGVAVALYPLFHIKQEIMINAMVIIMFILGTIVLGKDFAVKTMTSTIVYPIFISLLGNVTSLTSNLMLASLYSGILAGIGIGLVFRVNASTGGMDIPPLILAKYTNIDVATWVLVVDGLTILLGILTYDVESALIGLLSVFSSSFMINKVMMLGGQESKSIQIISPKYEEIKQFLFNELDRGCTLIPVQGGYKGEARTMLLVVVDKSQYPLINEKVHEIDPTAFMIVADTMDVKGEGFSYPATNPLYKK